MAKAQQMMKFYSDKSRKEVSFIEGGLVYLRLQSYKQCSLATRINEKLAKRFYGPFKFI